MNPNALADEATTLAAGGQLPSAPRMRGWRGTA